MPDEIQQAIEAIEKEFPGWSVWPYEDCPQTLEATNGDGNHLSIWSRRGASVTAAALRAAIAAIEEAK